MPVELYKTCIKCDEYLLISSFTKRKESPDGTRNECKKCTNSNKNFYSKKKFGYVHYKRQVMLNASKVRAKKKNIPHTIKMEDVPGPVFCPVLGVELGWNNEKIEDNSPSLDRIIPEKGYIPGNVAVISMLANRIKSSATADQILKVAQWLSKKEGDDDGAI